VTDQVDALTQQLSKLAQAVDADRGVTLYLDDGEGSLQPVARSAATTRRRPRLPALYRRPDHSAGGAAALIRVPNARTGVLLMERARNEHFTIQDRSVARLFARQLAEQPALGAPVPRAADRVRLLEGALRVMTDVVGSSSEEDATGALCRAIAAVLEGEVVTIHELGPDGLALTPASAFGASVERGSGQGSDPTLALGRSIVEWVVSSDRSSLVPDLVRDPRNVQAEVPRVVPEVSMIAAPIRDDGRPVGAVSVFRAGTRKFDGQDLALLDALAEFAGSAIRQARRQADRDRLVDRLGVLLEIQEAGANAADEVTLAELLAPRLADATGMHACVISRWDEGGTALQTLARHGPIELERPSRATEVLDLPHTRRVLLEGSPLIVDANAHDTEPDAARLVTQVGARELLLVPLAAMGRTIGLFELYAGPRAASGPRAAAGNHDLQLCTTIAHHVAGALENARMVGQLRQAADIDQLTGAATHRHLQERVRHEIARSARAGTQFSVLMVDLDGFKGVNDRHGHADGNRVLRNVAAGIKLAVRASDIVARYGGDEFVVVMPDTGERAARVVARRVVSGVSGQRHQLGDGSVARLTCSVGLAVYPEDGRTGSALLKSADLAMYAVKGAGGRDVKRGSAERSRTSRVPALTLKGR
jgi:diguanylate cyclase (GGDEF)-like protein